MRWMIVVPLILMLTACGTCGTFCTADMVAYNTVEVAPPPPTFVVDYGASLDVTTTEIDYY